MQQIDSRTPLHQTATPDTFHLIDYLEVIVRRKRMILRTAVASLALSILVSLALPERFHSTATVLPPQQKDGGLMGLLMGQMGGNSMAGLAGDLLGEGSGAELYVSILKSDATSDIIIDRFKLMEVYDEESRTDAYATLAKNVTITAGSKDGLIYITVEDEDPKRAAAMANAYVAALKTSTAELNIAGAGENTSFLGEQLAKAKSDLARAEDALKVFQARHKVVSVTDQASAAIGAVAALKAQLAAQEVQLATLQRRFTDNTTEVKSASTQVENLRRQIAAVEGNGSGGAIPGVASVPELGQQQLRLMREFKVHETLVEILTKQHELSKLSEAKTNNGVQVIQEARIPDKKAKPRRSIVVLISTAAATFLAILTALALEHVGTLPAEEQGRWRNLATGLTRPG